MKKEKKKDNQYKLKKAMAFTIGLIQGSFLNLCLNSSLKSVFEDKFGTG